MDMLNKVDGTNMCGGYRVPFDPRPLLERLAFHPTDQSCWSQLSEELHHQGDVGEASFAAVPHLVRICRDNGLIDWNAFALVGIIELRRGIDGNPDLPEHLHDDYFKALSELTLFCAKAIQGCTAPTTARAILGIIAIQKGLREHARLLLYFDEDELREMVPII